MSFLQFLPEDLKRETERKVTKEKMKEVMGELKTVTRHIGRRDSFSSEDRIHVWISNFGHTNWWYDAGQEKTSLTYEKRKTRNYVRATINADLKATLELNQFIAKNAKLKDVEKELEKLLNLMKEFSSVK
jgi:hypothetical protein